MKNGGRKSRDPLPLSRDYLFIFLGDFSKFYTENLTTKVPIVRKAIDSKLVVDLPLNHHILNELPPLKQN